MLKVKEKLEFSGCEAERATSWSIWKTCLKSYRKRATFTRLITVCGLSGIGKSAIALKLIEQIQTEFDCIIWLSLANTPALSTLQTELKQFFGRSQQTPLPTVIDYFHSSRCLLILDDVQNIFKSSQLAGQYLAGYEDYGKFFKQIATSSHQSCLSLLTWKKRREITAYKAVNLSTRTLNLKEFRGKIGGDSQSKRISR